MFNTSHLNIRVDLEKKSISGFKKWPAYELRDVFHMMLTTHQRESS